MNNCVLGRLFIFEINVGLLQKIIKNLYIFEHVMRMIYRQPYLGRFVSFNDTYF